MSAPHPPVGCRYRPRQPFRSPLWRLLVDHHETFLQEYDRRFAASHGPLHPEVPATLRRLVLCGDPNEGVGILSCPACRLTVAVPFSCKVRLCPSCASRRAEDLARALVPRLPEDVPYRHLVFTLPILMGVRQRLQEKPRLCTEVARLVARVLTRCMRGQARAHRHRRHALEEAQPGFVLALHTAGQALQFHPHYHVLVADGLWAPDGGLHACRWAPEEILAAFRKSVLASLVARHLLDPESARRMLEWPLPRSGFSVHVGEPVPGHDREALSRLVRYLVRPPLSLERLDYQEDTGQVRYLSKEGLPHTWPHAVDFLSSLCQHVPRPYQPRIFYYGAFANAAGPLRRLLPRPDPEPGGQAPPAPAGRTPWAKLVAHVWKIDPLDCPRCGARMKRRRALTERLELVRFLGNLGILGHPPRPPPAPPPAPSPPGRSAQRWPVRGDDSSQATPLPSPEELPQLFWEEQDQPEPASV
jgi:hypothetical protein